MTIKADLFFPKIFATGSYKSNMTFNAFRLHSKGQYNVTMKDVTGRWNIKGKLEKVDGEDYMKVYKFDLDPEANDMKFSVSGLFTDENLSECFGKHSSFFSLLINV
jgi:Haemolymph juvenile hormone binding protein (JHBP)